MRSFSVPRRYAACYLIVITLVFFSYRRNTAWRDDFALWGDVISKSGAKARVYYNMGAAYHDEKGFLDKAIEHYRRALFIEPRYPGIHNDLGDALRDSGILKEAVREYEIAVRLKPFYPKAHNNLGIAYLKIGDWEKALFEFRLAIKQAPDYPEPYYHMAIKDAGKKEEAEVYLRKFIETAPPEYKGMIIEAEHNLLELAEGR